MKRAFATSLRFAVVRGRVTAHTALDIRLTVPDLRVLLTHTGRQFVVSADQALESCVTVSWNLGLQVHRSSHANYVEKQEISGRNMDKPVAGELLFRQSQRM
jgi:hypothetical protein